ncbi:MAG: hypothetical protein KA166_08785, partial [Saprospiraceae bacterium]|nr:hypothetical protein [Saprospiraceae bacterium]
MEKVSDKLFVAAGLGSWNSVIFSDASGKDPVLLSGASLWTYRELRRACVGEKRNIVSPELDILKLVCR